MENAKFEIRKSLKKYVEIKIMPTNNMAHLVVGHFLFNFSKFWIYFSANCISEEVSFIEFTYGNLTISNIYWVSCSAIELSVSGFGFSTGVIGVIFIKWTGPDCRGRILLITEIVAAFQQVGNVVSGINSVGEADNPYDYTHIEALFSISGDFFLRG